MKTPEEILEDFITIQISEAIQRKNTMFVNSALEAMMIYGKQEFNRALDLAAEKAETSCKREPFIGTHC